MTNTTWISELSASHLDSLTPYESARRLFSANSEQRRTYLNANEAPESEHYELNCDLLNRYPDCQPEGLIDAYARYAEVDKQEVLATRGADEGIELLIRAFCNPSADSVLICPPTYGMYAISAQTFNVGVHRVPLQSDFSLNLDAIRGLVDKVKLVFLCSPNNPTGTRIVVEQVEAVLKVFEGKAIVVLDEAYIEFSANDSSQHLLSQYSNLVILRTLSKGFALAGLRCGFVLSSPEIKSILLKVIAPYPVPDPVAQIAQQALSTARLNSMRNRIATLNSELANLTANLQTIPSIEVIGAQNGNFVLFRTPFSQALMRFLVRNNVLIRDQSKQLMLDNCLRISVGNTEQNQALLSLINKFIDNEICSNEAQQ